MSTLKNYCKEECQWKNVKLEHSQPSDFYLSIWQTNRSAAPLLIFRSLLFLTSLAITVTSLAFYLTRGWYGVWWIYLTHWGLTIMTVTTGFAAGVSARSHFYGPISGEYRLPWYIKTYWVLFNISVPLAFLITIFYWTVLFEANIEEELDHGYDIAVHGINSLLMFLLLITAAHPCRLMHIYQPLVFAFVFLMFTLFYYLAGGTNREGEPFVYPVLNWKKPGVTIGVGAITGLLLVLLYVLVISITLARDSVARRLVKPSSNQPAEAMPLRHQPQATAV